MKGSDLKKMIELFRTDIRIFNLVYEQCKCLGQVFCLGAFEGFVMYASIVALAIVKVGEHKK